jgi:hypothetical protein
MTKQLEDADPALQCVMRAHEALFWEKKDDGRIFIDKPKRPKPRRGGESHQPQNAAQFTPSGGFVPKIHLRGAISIVAG